MSIWRRIPRRYRDRAAGVVPQGFWLTLRQAQEVPLDRRWTAGRLLLDAHPTLAAAPRLNAFEARAYSQAGQDGILARLLDLVGVESRAFVEFGVGDGSECNTANLAFTFGWSGLLMEIDAAAVERARRLYERLPVTVLEAAVTAENVDELIRAHGPADADVLSIDVDGADLWVWRAVDSLRPRVTVVEYNASFGPERSVTVPYRPVFDRYAHHASGFYHGASLAALAKVGAEKGYALVGCDSRGTDAFFVRRDLLRDGVEEVAPAAAFFPLWERAHLPLEEQFAQVAHLELVEI